MKQFDFNLKGYIQGKDGEYGRLAGLVIYPEARLVTNLIVKRGNLIPHMRVVPVATVRCTVEDNIYLSVGSHELNQYPQYRIVEREIPITELDERTVELTAPYGIYGPAEPTVPTIKQKAREGIASDQKVIEFGMALENLGGKIGKAVRVVVNGEHNEMSYVVVQRGLIFHEHLVVPITMVEAISDDSILVTGTDEMLAELPRYKDIVEPEFLT